MKLFSWVSTGLVFMTSLSAPLVFAATDSSTTVDVDEKTHLVFMREEEKLARDVYITLGSLYPNSTVFGKIDDSEQQHTDSVKAILDKYGIEDPSSSNEVGIFTGPEFGSYFTEKYKLLVGRAVKSELEALYVGAFIEELDMRDINYCPAEIVNQDNGISTVEACGLVYTNNPDIQQLYKHLLDGSDSHLEAYVKNIEQIIGEGNYQAQVLTQDEVDALLGR